MKLTDVRVVVISPEVEKYIERRKIVTALLGQLGFENIVHYISSTESYPKCLNIATINILRLSGDQPVLIVEDDIQLNPNWLLPIREYKLDSYFDALYLGNSMCRASATEDCHERPVAGPEWVPFSESHVRIKNMLSAHAILYASTKYKQAVINALQAKPTLWGDVSMSRLQPNFLILAHKVPMFYQAAALNDGNAEVERVTKFTLE